MTARLRSTRTAVEEGQKSFLARTGFPCDIRAQAAIRIRM